MGTRLIAEHVNFEPSAEQNRTGPDLPLLAVAHRFQDAPRFVRDGTSSIANFLNGRDPQGLELSPSRRQVDTNTHTEFEPRICGAHQLGTIFDNVQKSIWKPPALTSKAPRSLTMKTLLSNDTRYELLHEPYSTPIGPGSYWIEGGSPSMGPFPADSPTRSISPTRDPLRTSSAFVTTERPQLWKQTEAGHLGAYMSADFKSGHDFAVEWTRTHDQRTEPADFRYAGRFSEARKELPVHKDYRAAEGVDAAMRLTNVGEAAAPHRPSALCVPFMSREARIGCLPKERMNDTRLARPRHDEDPAALGPGSYGALTSIGGVRCKTYRLYSDPSAVVLLTAGVDRRSRTTGGISRSLLNGVHEEGAGAGRQLSARRLSPSCMVRSSGSSSFTGTGRAHKHGIRAKN